MRWHISLSGIALPLAIKTDRKYIQRVVCTLTILLHLLLCPLNVIIFLQGFLI